MNHKELANAVFEALNSRDFSELKPYMSEDLTIDFPGAERITGRRRALIFLNALLRKYQKLTFTVSDIYCVENRAFVVWSNAGESSSGEPYNNEGITLIGFDEEKLVFISDYFKDTSFVETS